MQRDRQAVERDGDDGAVHDCEQGGETDRHEGCPAEGGRRATTFGLLLAWFSDIA